VRVRALFLDTDGANYPTNLPLKPHIVVMTSPGRWNLYWWWTGSSSQTSAPYKKP
jgi:hypothetical protein